MRSNRYSLWPDQKQDKQSQSSLTPLTERKQNDSNRSFKDIYLRELSEKKIQQQKFKLPLLDKVKQFNANLKSPSPNFLYFSKQINQFNNISQRNKLELQIKKKFKDPENYFSNLLNSNQETQNIIYDLKASPIIDEQLIKSFNQEGSRRATPQKNTIEEQTQSRKKKYQVIVTHGSSTITGQYSLVQKKHNQDSSITQMIIINQLKHYLLGVFDGHGENGHLVSQFLKRQFATQFSKNQGDLKTKISKAILNLNEELKRQSYDTDYSGSTCCICFIDSLQIICANAGDSRAVIAQMTEDIWTAVDISRDHKPELPDERSRIIKFGGIVLRTLNDNGQEVGPYRVWDKYKTAPGISMSRSLGDFYAKQLGVIAEVFSIQNQNPKPELKQVPSLQDIKCLIIGSDGVWEKISSQDAVDIAQKFQNSSAEEAANAIVKIAHERWMKFDDCCDDITCVVAYFNKQV